MTLPRWIAAVVISLLGASSAHYSPPESLFPEPWTIPKVPKASGDTSYRLPADIEPIHYDLKLIPTLQDFTFSGSVVIDVRVVRPTQIIKLHAADLVVSSASVDQMQLARSKGERKKQRLETHLVKTTSYDEVHQFFIIELDSELAENTLYQISLSFSGKIHDDSKGFYRAFYIVSEEKKWMGITQFEMTFARRAFPCFDEPGFRATFRLSVALYPGSVGVVSNTRLSTISRPDATIDNRVWNTFEITPRMATYTLAWMVSELPHVTNKEDDFSTYSRPDALEKLAVSQEVGPKVLEFMEKYTEIPYLLDKMDQVAVPQHEFGAMENWGLVTYREAAILDDKDTRSASHISVATTIAHELAHQWFGNLVTPSWWSHVWLSEGFATLFEYLIIDELRPDWKIMQKMAYLEAQKAFRTDDQEDSTPMTYDVNTPEEIYNHFGSVTYSKGASVLRMLQHMLTPKTFQKGIQSYLKNMQLKNVVPDDLLSELQKAADADKVLPNDVNVAQVARTWTDQPGYPVIEVIRNYATGKADVSQRRFLQKQTTPRTQPWWVPLTWASSDSYELSQTKPVQFLSGDRTTIDLNPLHSTDWYIVNLHQIGFYRVNYDTKNWLRLSSFLRSHHEDLQESDRAMLVDDALSLAGVGLLDYTTALHITRFLNNERAYAPWAAAKANLDFLALLIRGTDKKGTFDDWIIGLVNDAYSDLGFAATSNTFEENLARSVIARVACEAGLRKCKSDAAAAYDTWADGKRIDPDTLPLALCAGLEQVGVGNFVSLFNKLLGSVDEVERANIIYAMRCANDGLKRDLLETVILDGGLRKGEPQAVWSSVASTTPGGLTVALGALAKYTSEIVSSYGKDHVGTIANVLAGYIISQEKFDELQKFVSSNSNLGISVAFTAALEKAQRNLKWKEKYFDEVLEYIVAIQQEPTTTPTTPTTTTTPTTPTTTTTPTTPITPTPPPSTDYRLPGEVIPTNYNLKIVPYLEPDHFIFTGKVAITVKGALQLNTITMHAHKSLLVDRSSVSVTIAGTGEEIVDGYKRDLQRDFLILELKSPLQVGQEYVITIVFTGDLNTDNVGFYRSRYLVNGESRYMATTHFEATHARKAFPCFDEPKYRATFDISVSRLLDEIARSNMDVKGTDPDPETGRIWVIFETTPKMPTYLVAFIVSEFESTYTTDSKIAVWVRPGAESKTKVAREVAPKVLSAMETYTGHNYELSKLDLFAIPDFLIGAMENWGLMTFRESAMLYDNSRSTTDFEMSVAQTVTHELIHLWFGDLVTIEWWSSAWLKEGMARLYQYLALDIATGNKYNAKEHLITRAVQVAMASDALETSPPLTNDGVNTPDEVSSHMGVITYSKGAGFLRMLMTCLGESTFKKGLNKYLTAHSHSYADPEDFARSLQEAADENSALSGVRVLDLVRSWTLQPGYPVITVIRDYLGTTATVKQARFLSHTSSNTDAMSAKWIVPLNFVTSSSLNKPLPTKFTDYMTTEQITIDLKASASEFTLFNIEQAGFYRVNYDMRNWMKIAGAIGQGQIKSAAQRAALYDDALVLARSQLLDTWTAMLLMHKSLPKEMSAAPWLAARKGLLNFGALIRSDQETSDLFSLYVEMLTGQIYTAIGWERKANEDRENKVLRDIITQLACSAGNINCRTQAKAAFKTWQSDPSKVDPDVVAATLCEGLRSNSNNFIALLTEFLTVTDPSLRSSYIRAFGCTDDTETKTILLESAVDLAGFESNEVASVFQSVIDHGDAKLALDFVANNFDTITKQLGAGGAANLLLTIAERISSKAQFLQIKALTDKYPSRNMQVALQTAETSLRWVEQSLPEFKDWLEAQVPTPVGPPTPPPEPSSAFRLPSSLVPSEYVVKLVPYLEGDFHFDGDVSVTFTAASDTTSITMNSVGLEFSKSDVTVVDAGTGSTQFVSDLRFDTIHEFVIVSLFQALTKGKTYRISIKYKGKLSTDNLGFYRTRHQPLSPSWTAATQFSPTYARRMLPCWDEPRFRSSFRLYVGRHTNQKALSTTPLLATSQPDPSIGNRQWDIFEETERIPTYLLGLVVTELSSASNDDRSITVWARDDIVSKAKPTLEAAGNMLSWMQDHTGVRHTLKKLDLVALRDHFFHAMENWGVYTFRESSLMNINESPSSAESEQSWVLTLAHELAHQWFGNLVTINWWDNAWLKEGFASYYSYVAAESIRKLWLLDYQFVTRTIIPAMEVDSFESAHPLNNKGIETPESVMGNLDTISYGKGGAIVRMMQNIFQANRTFETGLNDYLTVNNLGSAEPELLFYSLQKAVAAKVNSVLPDGVTVADVMRTWVNQGGYPVITVSRDYNTNQVTVTQERFLIHSPSSSTSVRGAWWVPLSYTTRYDYYADEEAPIKAWIEPQKASRFSVTGGSSEWLLINHKHRGYYRVNYDMRNWMLLAKYLKEYYSLIANDAKAMLVDDALVLARTNRLEYPLALELISFLDSEVQLEPWEAARNGFTFLDSLLLGTKLETVYKIWVEKLLDKVTATVGFHPDNRDTHRDKLLRGVVMEWACEMNLAVCTKHAKEDFDKWTMAPNSVAHDTLAATVCTGMRNGTVIDFATAVSNFLTEDDDKVRTAILRGLTCSKGKIFDMVLNLLNKPSELKRGEAGIIYKAASSHGPDKLTEVLNFLNTNAASVLANSGKGVLESALTTLADRVSTDTQYIILQEVAKKVDSKSAIVDAAMRLAKDNVNWAGKHMTTFGDALYSLTGLPNPDEPTTPTTSITTTMISTSRTPEPSTPTTTPVTTTPEPTEAPSEAGMGTGSVVAIVLACLIGSGLILWAGIKICKRHNS